MSETTTTTPRPAPPAPSGGFNTPGVGKPTPSAGLEADIAPPEDPELRQRLIDAEVERKRRQREEVQKRSEREKDFYSGKDRTPL